MTRPWCIWLRAVVPNKVQPEYEGDRRLLAYAVCAGLCLGIIPLVFSTPLVGSWYFGHYQNVPARILDTTRLAIGIYSVITVIHAIRGRVEGLAAARKRPKAVMAGQIAYTGGLFCTCAVLLPFGCAGWVIAISAIYVAPICATAAIYATLHFGTSPRFILPRKKRKPSSPDTEKGC